MKTCSQCFKENKRENSYFCSEECRNKYWPNRRPETLADKLKKLNEIRGLNRPKLNLTVLKCGYEVWIDFEKEDKCRKCGSAIRWATTDKNKRSMPVELIDKEWDTHFAYCDKSIENDKQLVKDAEEIFLPDKKENYENS